MTKFSISMSDKMGKIVNKRVESGDFNNTSEYFRDLVRRDEEKRAAREKLGKMLDEADAGPISKRSFDEIWASGVAKAKRQPRAK